MQKMRCIYEIFELMWLMACDIPSGSEALKYQASRMTLQFKLLNDHVNCVVSAPNLEFLLNWSCLFELESAVSIGFRQLWRWSLKPCIVSWGHRSILAVGKGAGCIVHSFQVLVRPNVKPKVSWSRKVALALWSDPLWFVAHLFSYFPALPL
jgi:hypothetical protein